MMYNTRSLFSLALTLGSVTGCDFSPSDVAQPDLGPLYEEFGSCGGTDKVTSIDPDTGAVQCAADLDTTYTAGGGLNLADNTFDVNFAGSGRRSTAARSDHDHRDVYWPMGTINECAGTNKVVGIDPKTGDVICAPDLDTDTLAELGCDDGQIVQWDVLTAGWVCGVDDDTIYTDAEAVAAVVAAAGPACGSDDKVTGIELDGSLRCEPDRDTTYTNGDGLTLSGTTFAVDFAGDGAATTAARSDHGHANLAPMSDLEGLRAEFEAADWCPRLTAWSGVRRVYTLTPATEGVTRCTLGADEMVKVGDFWIDRYEVVITDTAYWNTGACDGEGLIYGSNGVDDYPGDFPDNGNFTTPVYACSVSGIVPSRTMTWFQAGQACALTGKRLCRNDEWQTAVAGTVDPGSSDGTNGACVTSTGGPRTTGGGTACRSAYGAEDMIGNLWEWVADWYQAGQTWQTDDGQNPAPRPGATAGPWPAGYSPDNSDNTWNVNGRAVDSLEQNGLPAAAIRGGSWIDGPDTGAFALNLGHAPSSSSPNFGTRCCAGGR